MNFEPGPWYAASPVRKVRLWLRFVLPRLLMWPVYYAVARWHWSVVFRSVPHDGYHEFQTKYISDGRPVGEGAVYAVLISPWQASVWRVGIGWSRAGRWYKLPVE